MNNRKIRHSSICVFVVLILFFSVADIFALDLFKEKKSYVIALPVVFYKPETKFAAGLAGVYVVESKNKNRERHSSYETKLLYTQRKQIICEFYPDIWLGDYHLDISLLFSKYPYLFYGIGNQTLPENEEDYVSRIFQGRIDFQRTVYKAFALGFVADIDVQKFLETFKEFPPSQAVGSLSVAVRECFTVRFLPPGVVLPMVPSHDG